jgi:hypothetical protein
LRPASILAGLKGQRIGGGQQDRLGRPQLFFSVLPSRNSFASKTRLTINEDEMAQLYFHYSSSDKVVLNACERHVDSVADAREQAAQIVRSLIAKPGPEDWRDWVVHVTDHDDYEILSMSFSSQIGKPH